LQASYRLPACWRLAWGGCRLSRGAMTPALWPGELPRPHRSRERRGACGQRSVWEVLVVGRLLRSVAKGLLLGGAIALIWGVTSDRRRRVAVVGGVANGMTAIPFLGPRLCAALTQQLMGVYRAVAADVVSEADTGELMLLDAGPGYLASELAQRARNLQITAMDSDPTMVQLAESLIHSTGLGMQVKVAVGDARDISFPSGSFDYVLSFASLHRCLAPDVVLNEMHRLLKPGGKAWIYDLRREMPEEGWEQVRERIPLLERPLFEAAVLAQWRKAFTEGQIAALVAGSPFKQARTGALTVEIAGMKVPAVTKVALHKEGQ